MASVNSLPLSLVTLLLVLTPGLVGLRLFYLASDRKFSLSRTQLIVYSTSLSLLSAFILYLSSALLLWIAVPLFEVLRFWFNIATLEEFTSISLAGLVGIYFLHVLITLGIGYYSGEEYKDYLYESKGEVLDRREPWEFFFKESPTGGEMIEVTLDSGDIIRGQFNDRAFDPERRELFLDNPYAIDYSQGVDGPEEEDLGRSIFLHSDAIQQVVTLEEDPNSETHDEVRGIEIDSILAAEITSEVQRLADQRSLDEFEGNDDGSSND